MACRTEPLIVIRTAALAALALVLALTAGPILAVALQARGPAGLSAGDWAAVRFTLLQALLSAALSCLFAIPLARALARRDFPLRRLALAALGAPFLLPVIAAILGLVAIFGRAGLANQALALLGLPPVTIYGLPGVLLAHVFFNLPLVTRLLLLGWAAIPAEHFRLAAALSFTPRTSFRQLELPMLARVLPGAFLLTFLICLTSFTTVLALGGGPRATTIELAIYQAFRLDFDLAHAATLALVQLGLGTTVALAALAVTGLPQPGAGMDHPVRRWDSTGLGPRLADSLAMGFAALFLALPMGAVLVRGLPALPDLPASAYAAALRSLGVVAGATALALVLALPIALAIGLSDRPRRARASDAAAALVLAASPLVTGTGLFLILTRVTNPVPLALAVTAVVNALMALPFLLRALIPAIEQARRFDALADSLAMTGFARFRLVILPRLARPLGFGLGLTAAMTMGDLGVVTLFADPDRATLPMVLYGLMGAYRTDQAAAAALLLVVLSLGLFWIFDRGGRNAQA